MFHSTTHVFFSLISIFVILWKISIQVELLKVILWFENFSKYISIKDNYIFPLLCNLSDGAGKTIKKKEKFKTGGS